MLGSATSAVMYERFISRLPSAQAMLSSSPLKQELDHPPSLASVATTAAQSVVYIATHKKRQEPQELFLGSVALKDNEQLQELLRQLYGARAVRPEATSVGSGFIVSRDGEILTNHHVIADAEEITVRLATQDEYGAQVVGIDTPSDLALIKITAPFALSGALITEITKKGPAEEAGLQIGDIICWHNGRHLTNSHELSLLISRTPVGTDVEVSLVRQHSLQTRKVKIGQLIS